MSLLKERSTVYYVIGALICFGIGNGLSVSAINTAIFSAVPKEHSGVASGMVATMRNLGQDVYKRQAYPRRPHRRAGSQGRQLGRPA